MKPEDSAKPGSMEREDSLFEAARMRPGADRAAFLEGACLGDAALRERLELRLLRAEETEQGTATRVEPRQESLGLSLDLHLDTIDFPQDEAVGQMIGRYKLLEKVGEGGCGVVYVAEQTEPVRRRVALKVIKLGMDTKAVVARFEAERQALAMMDHPNIARVFDAGTTERGRPYFVMELVRGVRITDFCDQGKLDTHGRLELFMKVCLAIQHAHQKGIIHRDIKPSNILVTLHDGAPVPKVIDFGIAKATDGRLTEATVYTQLNQFIGTPAYMSPEQAEMSGLDIDTRADIYSLGVLLYELLTGRTPFDARELLSLGLDEMRRTIREKEPARPSTRIATLQGDELTTTATRRSVEAPKLVSQIQGDLDWIVMKALEKDRTRRYDTANGLALDVGRHLANEPVTARPPSLGYRFQKAVRRNRIAFIAGGAVATALVGGIVVSATQALRARAAERLAAARLLESEKLRGESDTARNDAEAIASFMAGVFQRTDPTRDAKTVTVAETLDAAAQKLELDLANQPGRQAVLRRALGGAYSNLGLHGHAVILHDRVRNYYLTNSGPENPNTLDATSLMANSYSALGHYERAAKLREPILEIRRRVQGTNSPGALEELSHLADDLAGMKEHDRSIQIRRDLLEAAQAKHGPEDPKTLKAMTDLGRTYGEVGRLPEAIAMLERCLKIHRRTGGPNSFEAATCAQILADVLFKAERFTEAAQLHDELGASLTRYLDPSGTPAMQLMIRESRLLLRTNRRLQAEEYQTQLLPVLRKKFFDGSRIGAKMVELHTDWYELCRELRGAKHAETIEALDRLAVAHGTTGNVDQGISLLNEEIRLLRETGQGESEQVEGALRQLEYYYLAAERIQDAVSSITSRVEIVEKLNGRESRPVIETKQRLCELLFAAGQRDKSLELRGDVLKLSARVYGVESPDTVRHAREMVDALYAAGRAQESEDLIGQYLPICKRVLGNDHQVTGEFYSSLGLVLDALGRTKEAIRAWREAVELNPNWGRIQFWLGKALVDQGRFSEALVPLRKAQSLTPSDSAFRKPVDEQINIAESMLPGAKAKPRIFVAPAEGSPFDKSLAAIRTWVEDHPEDTERSKHLALLALALGKGDEHLALCRRMLRDAAGSKDPTSHDRAAKAYLLQPHPDPAVLAMAVASARRTLQLAAPNDWNLPWFRLVVGFANYRDGNHAEADRYLTAATANSTDGNIRGLGLLIRSMARWRMGQVEEARRDFEAGSAGVDTTLDKTRVNGLTRNPDRLAIYLAFNEARTLLNSPVAFGK